MTINCHKCKKEFITYPSRIKIGSGKYCSNKCKIESSIGKHLSSKTEFKKGNISYNKGRKLSYEVWIKGKKNHPKISGINAHQWMGEDAGYGAKHTWLYKQLGKANHCSNSNCVYPRKGANGKLMLAPKRFEWSNISGEYRRDLSDWWPLCVSCHHNYDRGNVI